MKQVLKKRIISVLFFIFLLSPQSSTVSAEAINVEVVTGLLQLDDYKYPVYLFIPDNYEGTQSYPLILTVPGEGENPEENIEFWLSLAKRRSLIVLAPANIWPEDLPYRMDQWLINIKNDILQRYRIDKKRVFLVGKDGGAHYASYLGVNYPQEFSAVALLGGSWVGRYEQILKFESRPANQIPFYVVFEDEQEALFLEAQSAAYSLDQKGYPVEVKKLKKGEEFAKLEFKKSLLEWMIERSQGWRDVVQSSDKTFKEKVRKAVKEFFTV